ncbi:zinc ribbon domain-containing protein [Kosmotoga olearia]|uniref:DZANK-type domain-containing protein n=1 Tax=Kosmotoga olearia (strain ATCC BAA-1733 / DSM 21960 / TBF 19.5.1) TaxID=521045 RepID=C5CFU9_KOSOT|nr:zinc ribbon domain-containing protein [Kosmotoga olearia]ACR80443.1 hypothetical protein Kole_1758 [Kosmotoga olearia TBF 19.5.1]
MSSISSPDDFQVGKMIKIIVKIIGGIFTLVGTLMLVIAMMSFFVPTMYYAFPNFFLLFFSGFILVKIGRSISRLFPKKEVPQEKKESSEKVEKKRDRERYEHRRYTALRKYVRCHECDAENPPDAFRCVKCGASFENKKVCSLCYKLVDKDVRFCKNCGHDFNLD